MNRQRWNRVRRTAALLGALLLTAGCGTAPGPEPASTVSTAYTALPGIDLAGLLTAAQVAGGLDVAEEELAPPELYDDGTALRYATADYAASVDITLNPLSAELLALSKASCQGFTAAPHLGDEAWFDPEQEILYVYFDEYVLSVYVDKAELSASFRLILNRHLAALVLTALGRL